MQVERVIKGNQMATGWPKRPQSGSFRRRTGDIILVAVSVFLILFLGLAGSLFLWSKGEPDPYLTPEGKPLQGSISEKIFVNINGVQQGMFIKGKDARNPVLLYLHGGMPDYFLTERYPTGLDEYFTMVWWEQRGSGLSFSADAPPETVNPEQLISDALYLTNHLRKRFGQEKIYLMGHSGGTFVGIQAAARAPELFHAYIAVAQMSYQLRSEQLAYDYMLQRFRVESNAAMLRKLEMAPVGNAVPLPDAYQSLRDVAMHTLGIGTTHDMRSIYTGLLLRSFMGREYTLGEKINMWRGKFFSGNRLWNVQLSTD
jgi:pimeloyl-ACP methyl ester carboxylesterase